jgi:hypothetical protein
MKIRDHDNFEGEKKDRSRGGYGPLIFEVAFAFANY